MLGQGLVVQCLEQSYAQVQALLGTRDGCMFTQARFQAVEQTLTALGVANTGLAHGSSKVPHLDKLGQCSLQWHLSRTVQVVMGLVKSADQCFGHHQTPQLEPRVQNLGESPHIKNAAIAVQPFQG